MTLTTRNTVLFFGLVVIILLFLSYCFSLFFIFYREFSFPFNLKLFSLFGLGKDLVINFFLTLFIGIFSLCGWFVIRSSFSKTRSPEIFFFTFFLVSLSFEMIRVIHYYFFVREIPLIFGILFTRIVFFGRFFGLLCIFFSGLFSSWLNLQRVGIALSILILFCFTLAYAVPVNADIRPDFLYSTGIESELFIIRIFLSAFAVLNFLFAAILKRNPDYIYLSIYTAAIVLGRELVSFFFSPQAVIAGCGLLLFGSLFFGRKLHSIYLWI